MNASTPLNQKVEFNRKGAWNHWSIEVRKNGYEEVTNAGSVTVICDESQSESVGQPCEVTAKPTGTISQ